jgi:hypothetical protein
MEPKGKPASKGVSKKLLVVIVLMLLIILLPAAVVALPLSTIEVTVTNARVTPITGYLDIRGAPDGYHSLEMLPGQEIEFSHSVPAGTYEVYVYYWHFNESQYYNYYPLYETIRVSFLETERVSITLT